MKSLCMKVIGEEKENFLIERLERSTLNIYISNYRFKTYDNVIVHYPEKEEIEKFYEGMAKIIKEYIEYFFEKDIIKSNIKRNYFYLNELEREYIFEITNKILDLPDAKIGYKNRILTKIIKDYIVENKSIVIDGFSNFRIKKYKEIIENIVEVSVFSYLDLTSF